ncbi:hypothetical protein J6590_026182 [Homalodisca vitripennis]|nr:hypothetical protein J6590_026182 [Homalodisca vitripennis]
MNQLVLLPWERVEWGDEGQEGLSQLGLSADGQGSSCKGGNAIMKEVNVPNNKIPKSLHSVNRGVHLVVSSMMKTSKQVP